MNKLQRSLQMDRRLWNQEEDQLLRKLVQLHGDKKWTLLSKQMTNSLEYFKRNGKQCRERWFNHLNQYVSKLHWAAEETATFLNLYQQYGNKWSEISKYLPGRTQNSIKNYFYSNVRKLDRLVCKELKGAHKHEITKKTLMKLINQKYGDNQAEARGFLKEIVRQALQLYSFQGKQISTDSRVSQAIKLIQELNRLVKKKGKQFDSVGRLQSQQTLEEIKNAKSISACEIEESSDFLRWESPCFEREEYGLLFI